MREIAKGKLGEEGDSLALDLEWAKVFPTSLTNRVDMNQNIIHLGWDRILKLMRKHKVGVLIMAGAPLVTQTVGADIDINANITHP